MATDVMIEATGLTKRFGSVRALDKVSFEVRKGVRKVLLHRERKKFLEEEWPEIRARMKRMGIEMRDLPRD